MRPAVDRRLGIGLALGAVYVLWGSSYLATKIMVTREPPLLAAGCRFVLAACLLGVLAAARGERVPREAREWRTIVLCALANVVVSNGCNVLGMQHVPSNLSALLNATPALWIAWLGTLGPRSAPLTGMAKLGLAVGFAGVALILLPKGGLLPGNFQWQLLILLGCFGWSIGTMVYRNARPQTPPMMFTALQMGVGGLCVLGLAPLLGEPHVLNLDPAGIAAMLWLTVMSSCVAYTAYAYLVNHTSPAVVGTYAYVNPAIAALIGWLALGETLTGTQLAGTAVVFIAVALVTGYAGRRWL